MMLEAVIRVLRSRLCWTVALAAFFAVLAIEMVILVPSYHKRQTDLLAQAESRARAGVEAAFHQVDTTPASSETDRAERIASILSEIVDVTGVTGAVIHDSATGRTARFGAEITRFTRFDELDVRRIHDAESWCLIHWPAATTRTPFAITARLDTGWVQAEMAGYVGRIAGLVVLIAAFTTAVILAVLGPTVLHPILSLRASMAGVGRTPHRPGRFKTHSRRRDEFGDVTRHWNSMLERLGRHVVEIEQARREAETANRAKSRYLAGISHELRTPLNAIIGFSEAIRGEHFGPVGNPRYLDYVDSIHSGGKHLLSIINDLLDLSRIEAGHFELEEAETDLEDLVGEAERMLGPQAEARRQILSAHVAPGLPPLICDRRAMLQVLINLLGNAVKFTPQAGAITVTAGPGEEGGCEITVSDTGPGIPETDRERLIEPFERGPVAEEDTQHGTGTGLGLALVKSLVELHGGALRIESEPGAGTMVIVALPATRWAAPEPAQAAQI